MFLQLLRSLLEAMAGIEVIGSATSCQEAQELCELDAPDLLVLDWPCRMARDWTLPGPCIGGRQSPRLWCSPARPPALSVRLSS